MNGYKALLGFGVLAALVALALWAGGAWAGQSDVGGKAVEPKHEHKGETAKKPGAEEALAALAKEHVVKLGDALKALDAARKALDGGDAKAAIAEIAKARELVADTRDDLKVYLPAPAAGVVNVRCPIMGSAIDPAKVPESLIRQYKGQKVGFCCPACPQAWDNLTDEQKDAKLSAAMSAPQK
jgi:ribosome-associated protein YbcJ (S4-like RNA binding protein)